MVPLERQLLRSAAVMLVVVVVCGVFYESLSNGFVWDDEAQILNNPWIKDVAHLGKIFSSDVFGATQSVETTNYYRPVAHLLYTLTWFCFGPNARAFHAVNLLLHLAATVMVFVLCARLLRSRRESGIEDDPIGLMGALAAALFFGVHPAHAEAVNWISGVMELAFTVFGMLSFHLFLGLRERGQTGRLCVSVTLFALALFSKETAVVFLPLFLVYDLTLRREGWDVALAFRRYSLYLGAVALYLAMRTHALGSFVPRDMHPELTSYECVINIFPLFVQHLVGLLWPTELNVFHVFRPVHSILEPRTVVGLIVGAGYLASMYFAWRKDRLVFFGLAVVLVPILPLFYIRGIAPVVFAEQHLYLPSFGLALLLGRLLVWGSSQGRLVRVAVASALPVAVCLLSLSTVQRNPVWKDNLSLWSDAVKKSPDSAYVHESLAGALLSHRRAHEAIEQYQMILAIDPAPSARTYNNLGIAYAEIGETERAIESFDRALRISPAYARAHVGRGIAFHKKGWTERAIEEFRAAIRLDPYLADAHHNLGVAHAEQGNYREAEEAMRRASALNPAYYGQAR